MSVNDIWKANIAPADSDKKVLYMIDDKLLTDTTNVRIPSVFVRTVSLTKAA
ncbi:hypothetical protein [Mucilaginibacter sp. SP1R1]|uniref:hypothetical protein n=1 Tax=Mucilaginibacter sp. SP1R1 TaxID=2723091 RepID=UPI0016138270|nr:hypothetical protein [Mucilaginibacter sp. SP1R1]MBB6151229.1 hypothetical protein [Mucilaginibacter sp. SP1R1]